MKEFKDLILNLKDYKSGRTLYLDRRGYTVLAPVYKIGGELFVNEGTYLKKLNNLMYYEEGVLYHG